MYHVELRQFPHNYCRFNLSERELRESLLTAWARQEPVELGERRWDPRQASLTVIAGPRLLLPELAMGRGWRNALRRGSDVTAAVLAAAVDAPGENGPVRGSLPAPSAGAATAPAPAGGAVANPAPADGAAANPAPAGGETADAVLARQLLALLGAEPAPLLRAWQLALEQHPDRSPSECLALAERFIGR